MTHAPRECLAQTSPQIEAGRAIFALPTILGGPAARAGLSCAACHASGRSNARFLLPELTDRAGMADVTSEWASKVRGDGRLDPVPIPDLAGAAQRASYGAAHIPGLAAFIRGVVVDEFQGRDDPVAIDALTAYVAALGPACSAADERLTLNAALEDVDRAVRAAETVDDPRLVALSLRAARHLIGRVVERVPDIGRFAAVRGAFAGLAADLATLEDARGAASPEAVRAAAPGWRVRFATASSKLRRHARATYFDPAALRRALAAQPPVVAVPDPPYAKR